MTKSKQNIQLIVLYGFFLVTLFSCKTLHKNRFELEVFSSTEQEWGYAIKSNNKTILYQEYIPCVQGNIPFKSKSQAKKTGSLVLRKLINNKPPMCTLEELKQIGVVEND